MDDHFQKNTVTISQQKIRYQKPYRVHVGRAVLDAKKLKLRVFRVTDFTSLMYNLK